jgi:sugar/nucleoside kinase (ribokinase family)
MYCKNMVCVVGLAAWEEIVSVVSPPQVGENTSAFSLHEGPGGSGSTTAAWVRVAGGKVRLVCGLGADIAARDIAKACLDLGVEVLISPLSATPKLTIMIDDKLGKRTILSRLPSEGNILLTQCLGAEAFSAKDDIAWIDVFDDDVRGEFHSRSKGIKVLPAEHLHAEIGSSRTWDYVLGEAHTEVDITDDVLYELGVQAVILGNAASGGRVWLKEFGWSNWGQPTSKVHLHISGTDDAFRGGVLSALDAGKSVPEAIAEGAAQAARCSLHVSAWPAN